MYSHVAAGGALVIVLAVNLVAVAGGYGGELGEGEASLGSPGKQ